MILDLLAPAVSIPTQPPKFPPKKPPVDVGDTPPKKPTLH